MPPLSATGAQPWPAGWPPLPHFVPTSTAQVWPPSRIFLNVLGHHALAAPLVGAWLGATATIGQAEGLLSGGPDTLIATGLPIGLLVFAATVAGLMLAQPVGAVVGAALGLTAMATCQRTSPLVAGVVGAITSPIALSPLLLVMSGGVWLLMAVPASAAALLVVRRVVGTAQRETAEARRAHGTPPISGLPHPTGPPHPTSPGHTPAAPIPNHPPHPGGHPW